MSSTSSLVQIFSEYAKQQQGKLLALDLASYLVTVHSSISSREILDFRLSTVQFNSFIGYFRHLMCNLKDSSFNIEANCTDIEIFFQLLVLLSKDYDFSYQLGDYGGHALLKQAQQQQGKLPINIGNLIDEVIASILECGVHFPLRMSTSHEECVVKPLVFEFMLRPSITSTMPADFTTALPTTIQFPEGDTFEDSVPDNTSSSCGASDAGTSICVYVRQVPAGLHGAGQAAVGYIMWSSAVILSRWLALNTSLFYNKKILEIGAGNALCGVTVASFASHITMSDFNEVVLNNIDSIVDLNSGNYRMSYAQNEADNVCSCLGEDTSNIEVCRLDWNKLLPHGCTPSDASSTFQSNDISTSKYQELTNPEPMDNCSNTKSYKTYDVIIASDIVCCESDAIGVTHTLLHFLKKEERIGRESSCPVAIFVVPSEFHRYGVKNLISTLVSVGLVVHWRYISSSQFCNDAYTDTDTTDTNTDNNTSSLNSSPYVRDDALKSSTHPPFASGVRGCETCTHVQQTSEAVPKTSSPAPNTAPAIATTPNTTTPALVSAAAGSTCCCNSCEQILYNHIPLLESFRFSLEDDYLTSDLAEAPYYKWLFLVVHWKHPLPPHPVS